MVQLLTVPLVVEPCDFEPHRLEIALPPKNIPEPLQTYHIFYKTLLLLCGSLGVDRLFEVISGNFGIALGQVARLGFRYNVEVRLATITPYQYDL